jgi:2-keto-myo-inositol isomerase
MFPFKTALNASTLFPFKLDVEQQVRIAAGAGFDGIELWVRDILAYQEMGGTIPGLKACIASSGIKVANVIAFFPWADADEHVRQQGLAQAEREMRMLVDLGSPAVAAPPSGNVAEVTLEAMAGHFARLAALARPLGIEPYLEFWGMTRPLSRLSDAMFIAMQSGAAGVKILLDQWHMAVGGSSLNSLQYLNGANIGIVHVDDYPADSSAESFNQRVFPGEGIAPNAEFARLLYQAGYRGYLSLELFIENYGAESAPQVARRGLEAIKNCYSL